MLAADVRCEAHVGGVALEAKVANDSRIALVLGGISFRFSNGAVKGGIVALQRGLVDNLVARLASDQLFDDIWTDELCF